MVLGQEVSISYRKKLRGGLKGYFESDPPRIFIENNQNWQSVLLHEVIHSILWFSGHSQNMDEKTEESLVMALETGLNSILVLS